MNDLMRRAGSLSPQSFSEADNAVDMVWTTGATVRRNSLLDGAFNEELVVSPNAVRLDRLNAGAPLLDTHDAGGLSSIIGAVVPGSARLDRGRGLARVQLSRAQEHAGTVQNIRDGIIRAVSVGYRIHQTERVDEQGQIPLVRVTDWEPMELSAVPVGADPAAGFRDLGTGELILRANSLNSGGSSFGMSLIGAGNYDASGAWSFSAADGNELLGANRDNWSNYARHHLGVNPAAPDNTRGRWSYPFAKRVNGRDLVFRSGLVAIRQRAAQQGDTPIFDAAGRMIAAIDAKEKRADNSVIAIRMRMRQLAVARGIR